MFGLEQGSAVRRLVVVVNHNHTKRSVVKSRLLRVYDKHPEWQAFVKDHTWHEEFVVLFKLAQGKYECPGMITIETRYVSYRLENIPLKYLPAKPIVEAYIEKELEKILA